MAGNGLEEEEAIALYLYKKTLAGAFK